MSTSMPDSSALRGDGGDDIRQHVLLRWLSVTSVFILLNPPGTDPLDEAIRHAQDFDATLLALAVNAYPTWKLGEFLIDDRIVTSSVYPPI